MTWLRVKSRSGNSGSTHGVSTVVFRNGSGPLALPLAVFANWSEATESIVGLNLDREFVVLGVAALIAEADPGYVV